jgi:hypothetical protein
MMAKSHVVVGLAAWITIPVDELLVRMNLPAATLSVVERLKS